MRELHDRGTQVVAGDAVNAWPTGSIVRLVVSVAVGSTIACGGGGGDGTPMTTSPPSPVTVTSGVVDFPTATLARGQVLDLTPTLRDVSGTVVKGRTLAWSSDNPAVAKVSADGATGTVTASATGSATITGRVDGVTVSTVVTVVAFASVGPGPTFTCALTSQNKLYCAGSPYPTLAIPVAPQLRFRSVVVGGVPTVADAFACAIASDDRAYCWGANGSAQLGTGDVLPHNEPTPVAGDLRFTSISVGWTHACGITITQEAYCWGDGSEGKLGTGDANGRLTPTPVATPGGIKFSQVEAGNFATCGVAISGQAFCWGRNDLGQLGSKGAVAGHLGDFTLLPVPVDGASATKQIVTAGPKTCFLQQTGRAFCSGNNSVMELGTTTQERCYGDKPCSSTPVPVNTEQLFTTLAASQFATCGLTSSHETWCWGMDYENLFGSAPGSVPSCPGAGASYGCTSAPIRGADGLVSLRAARSNHCGLKTDGVLYCWGGNATGQRGWGGPLPDYVPAAFSISPGSAP